MVVTAEAHWDITRKYGYIFNLKPLGMDQIYTFEPEHIKVRMLPVT